MTISGTYSTSWKICGRSLSSRHDATKYRSAWQWKRTQRRDRTAEAVETIALFQQYWRTADEYGIADLICDLGHLAEKRGFEFVSEVRRGIRHWFAGGHAEDRNHLGPDAAVEITIHPRQPRHSKPLTWPINLTVGAQAIIAIRETSCASDDRSRPISDRLGTWRTMRARAGRLSATAVRRFG